MENDSAILTETYAGVVYGKEDIFYADIAVPVVKEILNFIEEQGLTEVTRLQIVPSGSVVTRDHVTDRLRIYLTEKGVIEQIVYG